MRRPHSALLSGLAAVLLVGCVLAPSPTPSPTPSLSPTPSPTASAEPSRSALPSATATPEPSLSLAIPDGRDPRIISVGVEPQVGSDGGEIVVTVTSEAEEMIEELVLRWPRELGRTLFLRPFEPSEQRIADGGPPLRQDWTKWVVGPGEEGEPAGTISLGWGPLLPGATLTIRIDVVRRAEGPIEFDLQVLSETRVENEPLPRVEILTLPDGDPAELRVEVP